MTFGDCREQENVCPEANYVRFALYVDGEYQGCGIFQALSELELTDEETDELTRNIDCLLNIPMEVFTKYRYTTSWFTRNGFQKFQDDITAIIEKYDETGLYEVKKLEANSLDNIVYRDDFQCIVRD